MNIEEYSRQIEQITENSEYRPLMPSDLIALMEVPDEDAGAVRSLIQNMVRAGKLALTKRGKVAALSNVGIVSGVFRGTSKQFGFVVPDGGGEDIFIPPSKTLFALDGDRVLVRIAEKRRDAGSHYDKSKLRRHKNGKLYPIPNGKDKSDKGPYGEIEKILERGLAERRVIGVYYEVEEKRGKKYHTVGWVEPDSKKLPYSVFVDVKEARSLGVAVGDKAEVKITKFPSEKSE
ncbi:MAG: hypothetical protein U0M06_03465, partial [Clostridia bacterium]|nr:hypothetical protein [Clostridia bacterium]